MECNRGASGEGSASDEPHSAEAGAKRRPQPSEDNAVAPIRTCVGCRRKAPAAELTRIARRPDGSLGIGRTLPGRGAWLCRGSLRCLEFAVRRGALAKALRAAIDGHDIEQIRTEFREPGSAARD